MAKTNRREDAIKAAQSGEMTPKQIWIVLIGLMSGMFLAALDQSIVATAIRTIADDLDGLNLQAWATTAYLITTTVSTPLYGKLGDIYGRRYLFLIAISIFMIGSVAAGFATTMIELASFRALQGIGGGGLFSLALTIVADIVPPRERAKYQGMFLAVFGTSSLVGPVVGGLFAGIDEFLFIDGWRWVFLINVPIGALALFMVYSFLHVPHTPLKQKIDFMGAAAIVLAVVPLLLILEQGRNWGWGSDIAYLLYSMSAVGLVSFILIERRMGESALIPLRIFKISTFSITAFMGILIGMGMFGALLVIPLILQVGFDSTPTQAGFQMLPMVGGIFTASILSGRITSATGKYRIFLNTGTATMIIGYLYLFFLVTPELPYWIMAIGMFFVGFGLGQLLQTTTVATQNAVEPKNIGVATSSVVFFRQMGGTLGATIFLSILFSRVTDSIQGAFARPGIQSELNAALNDPSVVADPKNTEILKILNGDQSVATVTEDSSFLIGVDERLSAPFTIGFVEAASPLFALGASVLIVAFIASWFVKEIPLRTKSVAQERAEDAAREQNE